jgi:aromatic ring-opening dioxygenase catalytic subunit (LigB family)
VFVVIVNTIQDMAAIQPVLFLSHGAGPSFYLDAKTMPRFKGMDKDSAAAEFLRNVNKTVGLKKPEAILVISAHWEESVWTVNTNSKHSLYFDYYNFPPETYELKWPAKGAPEVARKVKALLEDRGIKCSENSKRGLDHGVFVPLKLAYPDADVPGKQQNNNENSISLNIFTYFIRTTNFDKRISVRSTTIFYINYG